MSPSTRIRNACSCLGLKVDGCRMVTEMRLGYEYGCKLFGKYYSDFNIYLS